MLSGLLLPRRFCNGLSLSALLCLALGCDETGSTHDLEAALVASVVDGDTIRLDDGRTVRYIGVDTPEIAHNSTQDDECYGPEATQFNSQLVQGKEVYLEYDEELTDHYGRTLAYVWLGTGAARRMVNEELLFRGYGDLLIIEPNSKYESRLNQALLSAQQREAGLWAACLP